MPPTLSELSKSYAESAELLRNRITELRRQMASTQNQKEKINLRRRIRELTPMLKDMETLAETTANYYRPDFYRDPKCTSNCFVDSVTRHPIAERYSQYTLDDYEKEKET